MGREPGFRPEGLCQIPPAGSCQGSCAEREAQGSQGSFANAGKGDLPLEFPVFKTDGLNPYSKCVLGSLRWGVGLRLDFLPELTAAHPFC